ncbi:hypothetical protein G3R48_10465 [Shewanella intestini]|uniref:Uncharacterized protein n=2 Tax=Shewanellaceae TaxID=267890 RepID=A0ABS5I4U9_9GAMM|nr:hypothetical protein [Shewanella intestini]MRG36737.1 hypothetical protein [Shewanella sp. XMDDZSB0408]
MADTMVSMQGITVSAGLNISALLNAVQQANTMVWHAAIYNNFANGDMNTLLQRQLRSRQLQQLTIISQHCAQHWQDEFAAIVRPTLTSQDVSTLQRTSLNWCQQLSNSYPQQVHHCVSQHLPLQPILLIGDQLFIGQYAHSHSTSAQGLWLQIDSCALGLAGGELHQWYLDGTPANLCDWPQAIGRYVEECRQVSRQPFTLLEPTL